MADRSSYPSEQADKFLLRLPDGMRDRIALVAKENGRSMNAEIVARLERTFADEGFISKAESDALIEEARVAFTEAFRDSLKEASQRMRTVLIDEPEMLLHALQPKLK